MRITLALAVLISLVQPALCRPYESELGFECDVPPGWFIVNKDSLRVNPDFFVQHDALLGHVPGVGKDLLATAIIFEVAEVFMDTALVYGVPRAGVTILFDRVPVPQDSAALDTARAELESSISNLRGDAGIAIEFESYELVRIGDRQCARLEYIEPPLQRRTVQYGLPLDDGRRVTIAGSYQIVDAPISRTLIDHFATSFRLTSRRPPSEAPGVRAAKPN